MIDIRPAWLRDASYVTAHMRPMDVTEVMCQMPEGTTNWQLAHALLEGSEHAYIAYLDDKPVAFFGATRMTAVMASFWAIGTDQMTRVVPAINDFYTHQIVPALIEQGVVYAEARSHIDHHDAHNWLRLTGAEQHGPPMACGRDGEEFLLFRWTVSGYRAIRATKRRFA